MSSGIAKHPGVEDERRVVAGTASGSFPEDRHCGCPVSAQVPRGQAAPQTRTQDALHSRLFSLSLLLYLTRFCFLRPSCRRRHSYSGSPLCSTQEQYRVVLYILSRFSHLQAGEKLKQVPLSAHLQLRGWSFWAQSRLLQTPSQHFASEGPAFGITSLVRTTDTVQPLALVTVSSSSHLP